MKRSLILMISSFFGTALLLQPVTAQEQAPEQRAQAPHQQDGHGDEAHGHEEEGHEEGEEHTEGEAHAEDEANGHEEGHGEHEEPALTMSPELLRDFGAMLDTAGAGVIRQEVSLPGEVQLNREAVAHITPRFPATVIEVRANTGDVVEAGQTLAVAESSETLARFELKSLIDGVVTQRHITLGEHLTPDDTAFVVADLSTLWVDIALYPKQVPLVKVGQTVRLTTSHGPEPVQTTIDYVAPVVDERTRTGLARVFLANENGLWKPGMFIEADIALGEYPASVVVPRSAVIDLEGSPTVFVQQAERWEPRPVVLGRQDGESVEIVEGLRAGETYVSEGGFVLKAQLQKSEFESGHNH